MGLSGSKTDAFLIDDVSTSWALGTKIDAFLVEAPLFTLSSLTPDAGYVGTIVVLAGINFGALQGGSYVSFGGVTATVTSWSDTSITVIAPAITNDVNVWVYSDFYGINSNSLGFNLLPLIFSVEPPGQHPGDPVTITGQEFGTSGTVEIDGVNMPVVSWSDTVIVANLPAGAGDNSGWIIVTNDDLEETPPFLYLGSGVLNDRLRFVDQDGSPTGHIDLNDNSNYCLEDIEFPIPRPRIEWRDPSHLDGRTPNVYKWENRVITLHLQVYGTDKTDLSTNARALWDELMCEHPTLEWRPIGWTDSLYIDLINPPLEINTPDWFETAWRDNVKLCVMSNVEIVCEAKPFLRGVEQTLTVFENLAPNGDMEDYGGSPSVFPDGWTVTVGAGSSITQDADAWHGDFAALLTKGAGDCIMESDTAIAVDASRHYYFDAFAKRHNGTDPVLTLALDCYGPGFLGTITVVSHAVPGTNSSPSSPDQYLQHAHIWDASMGTVEPADFPVGTTSVVLHIENETDNSGILVDQIYFGCSEYSATHRVESPVAIVVGDDEVHGDMPSAADVYIDKVYWDIDSILLGQREKYHAMFNPIVEPTATTVSNVCYTQDYMEADVEVNLVQNPSFETSAGGAFAEDNTDAFTNWTITRIRTPWTAYIGASSVEKYEASYSLAFFDGEGWGVYGHCLSDAIAINPANSHTISCEFGTTNAHAVAYEFEVWVGFYDGATLLSAVKIIRQAGADWVPWTRLTGYIRQTDYPAGTDNIRIDLWGLFATKLTLGHANPAWMFIDDVRMFESATAGELDIPLEAHEGRYLPTANISVSDDTPVDSTLTIQGQIVSDTLGPITNLFSESNADFGDPDTRWTNIAIQQDRWKPLSIPTFHVSDGADLTALSQRFRLLTGPLFDTTRVLWLDYLALVPVDRAFARLVGLSAASTVILDCRSDFRGALVSLDGTLESATALDQQNVAADLNFAVDPDGMNLVFQGLYDNATSDEPRPVVDMAMKYTPLYLIVPEQ